MATKTKDSAEEITQKVNPDADVHHMIRRLQSVSMAMPGVDTVDKVDADVRNWLQAGYKLKSTHVLGLDPHSANILYVFVKDES